MSHEGAAPVSLLDPLICFCRAHGRDRQTDHARCVATGRIFTLCIAMRPKITANAKIGDTGSGNNMNGTKLVVNASSSLLLATARARCVFVHVAVRVRLPSPRALRRNDYIYQCGGRSAGRRFGDSEILHSVCLSYFRFRVVFFSFFVFVISYGGDFRFGGCSQALFRATCTFGH